MLIEANRLAAAVFDAAHNTLLTSNQFPLLTMHRTAQQKD
jgi:hypothetical protein